MSNQAEDGWYPECEECNCGNLGKVICINCFNKRNAKVKQVIKDEIKHFEKPKTELNNAMVFYLKELLQKLGLEEK